MADSTHGCTTIRFAGFGGQGIVKAGQIFGTAAVAQGKVALQNQSYGSSARGGLCTSDVAVSEEQILEIEPDEFDVLLLLSQDSANAFISMLRPGGTLIYEQDLVTLPEGYDQPAHGIAATQIATQELGRRIVMNMVVIGYCAALTGVVAREQLEQTIRHNVPPGTEQLNLQAFDLGWSRGSR